MRPGKESDSGATLAKRGHRQRAPKADRHPARKERPQREKANQTNEVKVGQDTEEKLKSTVVDIDRVRDDEVKEENLGLLEAAEQEESELFMLW